jgi:hypothetical protein
LNIFFCERLFGKILSINKIAAEKVWQKNHSRKFMVEKVRQKNRSRKSVAEKSLQQHGWGLFMRDMTHLV